MRILKSKNNRSRYRNRLGQQLVAVLFTLGLAGSPFGQTAIGEPWNDSTRLPNPAARARNPGAAATAPAATATPVATAATPPSGGGGGDPGCIKTFEELGKSCAGAMASNDVASQAGVAAATQAGPCRAGMTYVPSKNSQDNPSCVPSINTAAGQQEKSATIAQGANANVSAACTETLRRCEEACGQAIKIHRANASASASNPTIANKEINYSHIAEKNLESCKKDMGMVATETGISATTLGLAAAAAGGIFLLTKSGKKSGDSSGDDNTTSGGSGAGTDPISTDPDSGFQTYDKMVEYWTTNNCVAVLSAKISVYENITSNEVRSKCSIISKDPSFSSSLAALGTCSDVDNYGRPDCFDRLNNYCLQVTETSRSGDPTCAGFCVSKPEADSCNYVVGFMLPGGLRPIQPIDQNATPDQTSSSGSPFNTGNNLTYRPLAQRTATGTQGYVSSTQSQTGSSISSRTEATASGTRTLASAGAQNCSSAQMMNKPECEAPMTKYCSQYGSEGKGCSDFCKKHKNVCKK